MPARSPKPSRSEEVIVGTRSQSALESSWLADFQSVSAPRGRPEGKGWLTVDEMAEQAGVCRAAIEAYIRKCPPGYWDTEARVYAAKRGHWRRTMFYRKHAPVLKKVE